MNYCQTIFPEALKITLLGLFVGLTAWSCGTNEGDAVAGREYIETINGWHQERIESLKESDGWLSLVGLYQLEEGSVYTVGADPDCDIVFPAGKAPALAGRLTVEEERIRMQANEGVEIRSGGEPVTDTTLASDAEGSPTILTHGPLEWYVIERGGEHFLRVKDNEHPNLADFEGIERFPVSRKWRLEARFREFEQPDSIGISNVLGQLTNEPLHGILEFDIEGDTYTLAPLGDPESEEEFFIIFGDNTNGEETYGGGRYLYVDTPDEDGITYIDFNKAYNPPCVFTEYATCPLPPARNRLDLEITAGEKNYEGAEFTYTSGTE